MERKAQAKEAQVKAQTRLKRSPAIIAVRRDIGRPTAGARNGRMGKATGSGKGDKSGKGGKGGKGKGGKGGKGR